MKPKVIKYVAAGASGLLLTFVSSNLFAGVSELWQAISIAGPCVLLMCCLGEWLFYPAQNSSFSKTLRHGLFKGALIGACTWITLGFMIAMQHDGSDKWPLVVIAFLPFPLVFGAIMGIVAHFVRCRLRLGRVENAVQPSAAPSGGPATGVGKLNVTDGPPSVS